MSEVVVPGGIAAQPAPGWWLASDGRWYPPQPAPAVTQTVVVHAGPQPVVAPGIAPGAGSLLLNVLWLVLSGFWLCCAYVISGILQCLFIVTIPFGIQSF